MEPRQTGPGASFENGPAPLNGGEGYSLPEVAPGFSPEYGNEALERKAVEVESLAPPPVLPVVPAPLPQVSDDSDDQSTMAGSSSVPDSAADEDLIEKEWVDKAKKIIEETKEDPYKRELEIGLLQREYIRKRYGRKIGVSGEQ